MSIFALNFCYFFLLFESLMFIMASSAVFNIPFVSFSVIVDSITTIFEMVYF